MSQNNASFISASIREGEGVLCVILDLILVDLCNNF